MNEALYFAAINRDGFANTWDAYAFRNEADRNQFVADQDDLLKPNGSRVQCRKIRKREIYLYTSPLDTFAGEQRRIDWDDIPGFDNADGTASTAGGRIVIDYAGGIGERLNK